MGIILPEEYSIIWLRAAASKALPELLILSLCCHEFSVAHQGA